MSDRYGLVCGAVIDVQGHCPGEPGGCVYGRPEVLARPALVADERARDQKHGCGLRSLTGVRQVIEEDGRADGMSDEYDLLAQLSELAGNGLLPPHRVGMGLVGHPGVVDFVT